MHDDRCGCYAKGLELIWPLHGNVGPCRVMKAVNHKVLGRCLKDIGREFHDMLRQ